MNPRITTEDGTRITTIEEIKNKHKGDYVMSFDMGSCYVAENGARYALYDTIVWESEANSVNDWGPLAEARYITEDPIPDGYI